MKALLILVAAASTAYVGYSYSSTDGESCLVCPMTGEPVFASAEADSKAAAGCAFCAAKGECSASCSEDDAAMLTSTDADDCHGNCEEACDKEATEGQEQIAEAGDSEEEIVAETTEAL